MCVTLTAVVQSSQVVYIMPVLPVAAHGNPSGSLQALHARHCAYTAYKLTPSGKRGSLQYV